MNALRILALVLLGGVIAVSAALGDNEAKRFTVTSSLDGKKVLPLRIHWVAHLHHLSPSQVLEVDYFIDGKKAWDEKQAPYYYGGYSTQFPTDAPWHGGNSLATSFLTPGMHTFSATNEWESGPSVLECEGRLSYLIFFHGWTA